MHALIAIEVYMGSTIRVGDAGLRAYLPLRVTGLLQTCSRPVHLCLGSHMNA